MCLCITGSFRLQDMSPRICFRGTKYEIYREVVAYLHHIVCRRARLFDQNCMQVQYVDSYHGHHICPLRRRHSFTSRKLYVCLETFLCFFHTSDRAYVYRARCIGLFLLLFVLTPHDSNAAVCALLTVLRVVYAIVRLSSGNCDEM